MSWTIKLFGDRRWTDEIGIVPSGTFSGQADLAEEGRFTLTTPLDRLALGVRRYEDVHSILVMDAGFVLYAGLVRNLKEEGSETGETVEWAGVESWALTQERHMFPPGFSTERPWDGEPWAFTGDAASVAARVLVEQMGSGAGPRRDAGVQIRGAGPGTRTYARSAPPTERVDDVLALLLDEQALICTRTVGSDGAVLFTLGAPRDRRNVRFSHRDLTTWTKTKGYRTATAIVGIGPADPDTKLRPVIVESTGATGPDRIEKVIGVNGTDDEQVAAVEHALVDAGERLSIAATITPEAAARYQYGDKWRLGDIVTVEIRGDTFSVPIASAQFRRDAKGVELVTPILGGAPRDLLDRLFRRVQGLERRERRRTV